MERKRMGSGPWCVIASLAAFASLALSSAPAWAAGPCSNEAVRAEQQATLPDCRAYELVTPSGSEPYIPTTGANVGEAQGVQAATEREGVSKESGGLAWFTFYAPAGSRTPGPYYRSRRGVDGWSYEGLIPPQSVDNGIFCLPLMLAYSPDLSVGLLADGPEPERECGQDDPPLVTGEPTGVQNLFVRDNTTGSYRLVDMTPQGVTPAYARFQTASQNLGSVIFDESAQLTPNAPSADDIYDWSAGVVRLVTVLNGGEEGMPVLGSLPWAVSSENVLPGGATFTHVISNDGSRVFFEAEGKLYVREHPSQPQSPVNANGQCADLAMACTVQLDLPEGAKTGGGGGQFKLASPSGSRVLFTDDASAALTGDTVSGSGQNLYEAEIAEGEGKREVHLTDLTPAAQAEVEGVAGASDDGSYVYFVADGALSAGATAGQPNLYVRHGASTRFIATLSTRRPLPSDQVGRHTEFDMCNWTPSCETARVSPDGRFIAFNSVNRLTGYDNVPANPAACDENLESPSDEPCSEVYLYDSLEGTLSCASCNPAGTPPTGPAGIYPPEQDTATWSGHPGYLQRNLSNNGTVFFNTPDPLVSQDSDGVTDVYEFENGQIHLISSGTSERGSYFADASESGDDAFFFTTQQLTLQDSDGALSIYDARAGGGFAQAHAQSSCGGEGCRGSAPQAPAFATPASVSFLGAGNLTPAQGKPVKVSRSAAHRRHRHHARRHARHHVHERAGKGHLHHRHHHGGSR